MLFAGKVEDWEEQKNGVPEGLPIIAFPHYKGCSKIDEGHQWHAFINQFEPLEHPHQPKLNDTWTIIFTSGTTGNPKELYLTTTPIKKPQNSITKKIPLILILRGKTTFSPTSHLTT